MITEFAFCSKGLQTAKLEVWYGVTVGTGHGSLGDRGTGLGRAKGIGGF